MKSWKNSFLRFDTRSETKSTFLWKIYRILFWWECYSTTKWEESQTWWDFDFLRIFMEEDVSCQIESFIGRDVEVVWRRCFRILWIYGIYSLMSFVPSIGCWWVVRNFFACPKTKCWLLIRSIPKISPFRPKLRWIFTNWHSNENIDKLFRNFISLVGITSSTKTFQLDPTYILKKNSPKGRKVWHSAFQNPKIQLLFLSL